MSEIIILACSQCERKNYSTARNKKSGAPKLQRKKYCRSCRKHTLHKEEKA